MNPELESPTITCRDRYYELKQQQIIPRPIDDVFEFFSDPHNLEEITPERLCFEIKKVGPRPVQEGTTIEYRLSLHGIPLTWVSEITQWDPPELFCDEMIRGPYSNWKHTHRFVPNNGSTTVEDHVEYTLPFGFLGRMAHGIFVKRDLTSIFQYRQRVLSDLFLNGTNRNQ